MILTLIFTFRVTLTAAVTAPLSCSPYTEVSPLPSLYHPSLPSLPFCPLSLSLCLCPLPSLPSALCPLHCRLCELSSSVSGCIITAVGECGIERTSSCLLSQLTFLLPCLLGPHLTDHACLPSLLVSAGCAECVSTLRLYLRVGQASSIRPCKRRGDEGVLSMMRRAGSRLLSADQSPLDAPLNVVFSQYLKYSLPSHDRPLLSRFPVRQSLSRPFMIEYVRKQQSRLCNFPPFRFHPHSHPHHHRFASSPRADGTDASGAKFLQAKAQGRAAGTGNGREANEAARGARGAQRRRELPVGCIRSRII